MLSVGLNITPNVTLLLRDVFSMTEKLWRSPTTGHVTEARQTMLLAQAGSGVN